MKWRRKLAGLPSSDASATWSTGSDVVSSSCRACCTRQAATDLGFAAPYVLSMLRGYASPAVLLLGVAALAAPTLAVTGYQAARG
jgi:hypothetical protein